MSTLNSHYDLLTDMVINGKKPSIESLAKTGLDVEILQKVVKMLIPRLDYMRGYKSLGACTGLSSEEIAQLDPTLLDRHNQVLSVCRWYVYQRGHVGYVGIITVMLSRRKPWIVYTESCSHPFKRSLERVNRTADLNYVIHEKIHSLGDYISLIPFDVLCDSPALYLVTALMHRFTESVAEKSKDVEKECDILEQTQALVRRFV